MRIPIDNYKLSRHQLEKLTHLGHRMNPQNKYFENQKSLSQILNQKQYKKQYLEQNNTDLRQIILEYQI